MPVTLRDKLAPVLQPLLPEFFDNPTIEEKRATCDDCAMCNKAETPAGVATEHFNPITKCCTYHPTLPNFLAGAVFADPRPELEEGRRRLREKIPRRIGVTPQWLAAPRKVLVHLEASRYFSFGRAESLQCPYYEKGGCTIWQHREAVCRTFFCKHESFGRGWSFWDALKQYFFRVEVSLTKYAISQVCPSATEPNVGRLKMTIEDLDDKPPPEAEYAKYWGEYLGREEEFYVKCHEVISGLDRARAKEILDATPQTDTTLAEVMKRYDAVMNPTLEPRLVKSKRMAVVPSQGGVVVTAYSRFDPFFMSDALKSVVDEFREGESVQETLARLKRDKDLDVPAELVLQLQMLEVMVPPDQQNAELTKGPGRG